MSDDLSSKSVLVYDTGGLFLSLAFRLARDFGRVAYHTPNSGPFPLPYASVLGDGFDEIERCEDFHKEYDAFDLIVFPDVGDASLQVDLELRGKRVWGSRTGDDLELRRAWFRKRQGDWGLEVPEHKSIKGLSRLRSFLGYNDGWFVKVSRYRGLCETFQYHAGPRGDGQLDLLAMKLGPLQDDFPFLVEAPIDAIVETGIDEFCIDGNWPETVVQGIECKDKAYIGVVTPLAKMPESLRDVNDALTDFLKETRYRNFFSGEVRITEEKIAYLTDPTCRQASPAGECLLELIGNLSEVIWHGADGDLIEPEYSAQFAAQAIVDHPDDDQHWRVSDWPEEVRQWFKPSACVGLDEDRIGFPPFAWSCDAVGSVIGIGDSVESAIEQLKEHAAVLEEIGLHVHVPALADVLSEIEQEQAQGIKFSPNVPEPSIVVEP